MAGQVHAHWLVARTAREMAHEVYEECAKKNEWYRRHPDRGRFVEATYGSLLQQAREFLAMSLQSNRLSEDEKQKIADALIKDNDLIRRGGHKVLTRVG